MFNWWASYAGKYTSRGWLIRTLELSIVMLCFLVVLRTVVFIKEFSLAYETEKFGL
jgi:hypothetical protein